MQGTKQEQGNGIFVQGAAYTFAELRRRGFSGCALRQMQRDGLQARRVGKIKVILGRDLLAYFEALPVDSMTRDDTLKVTHERPLGPPGGKAYADSILSDIEGE